MKQAPERRLFHQADGDRRYRAARRAFSRKRSSGQCSRSPKPKISIRRSRFANDSEYGLTGAVFTLRSGQSCEKAKRQFFVGNLYINRKCTGAMVGAHPFGGFNMSGTDSKAGGPDYLLQFVQAKSIAEKVR